MPGYLIKIQSDKVLTIPDLEVLEDVVYDALIGTFGSSAAVDVDGVGETDVQAVYN